MSRTNYNCLSFMAIKCLHKFTLTQLCLPLIFGYRYGIITNGDSWHELKEPLRGSICRLGIARED